MCFQVLEQLAKLPDLAKRWLSGRAALGARGRLGGLTAFGRRTLGSIHASELHRRRHAAAVKPPWPGKRLCTRQMIYTTDSTGWWGGSVVGVPWPTKKTENACVAMAEREKSEMVAFLESPGTFSTNQSHYCSKPCTCMSMQPLQKTREKVVFVSDTGAGSRVWAMTKNTTRACG